MLDPFAASSDPDIPTPSRNDLLNLVHGSVRDQLAAGTLDAKHAENEWAGARRQWDEGHKRDADRRRAEEANQPDKVSEMDVPTPDKWLPTTTSDTGVQKEVRKIRLSMEDNTITPPQEIELPLEDALDPMQEAATPPPEPPLAAEPKPFDGVFQDFDPSQASPLLGEFAKDSETGRTIIRRHTPGHQELEEAVNRTVKVMGEAAELLRRKPPKPPSDEPPATAGQTEGKSHDLLVRSLLGICEIAGALIVNKLDAPLWLTVPTLVWGASGIALWSRITKTKMRHAIFWIPLTALVLATLGVVIARNVPRASPQQPTGTIRIKDGETVTARVKSWGTTGEHNVYATVNTAELAPLADDYRLLIVCRVQDSKIDAKDDLRIDKSGLFSITGTDQRLEVVLSQNTMNRVVSDGWINIYILLVPARLNPKELRTVNELTQNGSYVVGNPSMMVHGTK